MYQTGQKIRQFRKREGITQLELELRIDASFGSISRMESGQTNPSKETLHLISEALELDPYETAYLFGIEIRRNNPIIDQLSDSIYQV